MKHSGERNWRRIKIDLYASVSFIVNVRRGEDAVNELTCVFRYDKPCFTEQSIISTVWLTKLYINELSKKVALLILKFYLTRNFAIAAIVTIAMRPELEVRGQNAAIFRLPTRQRACLGLYFACLFIAPFIRRSDNKVSSWSTDPHFRGLSVTPLHLTAFFGARNFS